MKDRQYNGQKKKGKGTNNYLRNITQKTKDWATLTHYKSGSNSYAHGVFIISIVWYTLILQITFEGSIKLHYGADIALDDITISKEPIGKYVV